MAFLENFEHSAFGEPNPKVVKIIEDMKNDPDFQELMKKLAQEEDSWENEGGIVTEKHLQDYEERLKYMEDHGI
jgi:hypothetical protein